MRLMVERTGARQGWPVQHKRRRWSRCPARARASPGRSPPGTFRLARRPALLPWTPGTPPCTPASMACRRATVSGLPAMSMPVTRAPAWAMDSARMPPPQPTSTAVASFRSARSAMNANLTGLMSCRGLKSPSRIPPAVGQGFELLDLCLIDVAHAWLIFCCQVRALCRISASSMRVRTPSSSRHSPFTQT